jgi:hypothetical protein
VKASAYDLEGAAAVLVTLERRRRRSWSTSDFAGLARVRVRMSAGELLAKLAECGLVNGLEDQWVRSDRGDAVVEALLAHDWAPYCDALLVLEDVSCQAINLIRVGTVQGATWRCLLIRAQKAAPTLTTILSWRADFRDGPTLAVPVHVLEVASNDYLMAAARETPTWVKDREAVGHRAEAYSMRHVAAQLGASRLLWVSVDVGDQYGYDIEADDGDGQRAIEVKGSRGRDLSFVLTAKERAVAERLGAAYEIQYWGEISLDREPEAEYELLVGRGYPRVIQNPASVLDGEEWTLECVAWHVCPTEREE